MFFNIAQTDSKIIRNQDVEAVHIDRNFRYKYDRQLDLLERVYPMALESKRIIDSLDADQASISKNRKKKTIAKKYNNELEEQFEYALKDLYVSEGKLLMKLIHRETGLSVYDILAKYRGKTRASIVHGTFKLFGHDSKSTFDAKGDDWITEIVIQDIESGKVDFDKNVRLVTKSEFKQGMKDYRQSARDYRKDKRHNKKEKSSKKPRT